MRGYVSRAETKSSVLCDKIRRDEIEILTPFAQSYKGQLWNFQELCVQVDKKSHFEK